MVALCCPLPSVALCLGTCEGEHENMSTITMVVIVTHYYIITGPATRNTAGLFYSCTCIPANIHRYIFERMMNFVSEVQAWSDACTCHMVLLIQQYESPKN